MSRINTNVQSQIAQRVLGQNNTGLAQTLERLSTGVRINRGKDDPAGLIASEALRAEKTALNAAINNADRADQVVNIAEGGLQEVSSLLTELQGLVTTTANRAGLTREEKEANQLQIDSILQTIDRISSVTSFQGIKLLNGNLDYQVTSVATGVADYRVNGAKFAQGSSLAVSALVTGSAQQGGLYLSTNGNLNLGGNSNPFIFEVTGSLGTRQFSFSSGTSRADIAAAINTFTDVTGVAASVRTSGTTLGINLDSSEFGTDAFVSVKVVQASGVTGTGVGVYNKAATNFAALNTTIAAAFTSGTAANGVRDAGQDIAVTINGVSATAKGKSAKINTDFLQADVTFTTTQSQTKGTVAAFTVSSGGADFQLASDVNIGSKVAIGVGEVAARKLGNSSTGYLSSLASGKSANLVDGNVANAQKIISESIKQVTGLRGRLGAFQRNTVGATVRNLNVSLENTSAAESTIRDTNFAAETASLTRSQILAQAATNILSLANSQPQQVLGLLRG